MRSSVAESRTVPGMETRSSNSASRSASSPPIPTLNPQRQPSKPVAHQRKSHFPLSPSEGWLAMLLLAVAVYSVVFSIISANWVSSSFILLWSTLAGLLLGLLIAKIHHFPQAILHLAACLAGHWLSIWLTSVIAYHISWLLLLENLRSVIGGGFTSAVPSSSDMVFLFYLSFLCFFLGYFGAWLIYRAHLPWLVALVYCSIMLVNLNYVKQDLSVLMVILLGALILLIARIQLASQLAQWVSEGLHTNRSWLHSITLRFMQITSIFALLALLISLVLPILGQPGAGATFWDNLDNAWTNITHGQLSLANPGSLIQPFQAPANFFGDQLAITGSVNLPNGKVLSYTTTAHAQPQYLEGFTYDHFDGHTWTAQVSNLNQPYAANALLPLDIPGNGSYNQVTTSVTILLPPEGTRHYIFAPAQPTSFDVPTVIYGNAISSAWTQQTALTQGEHYQATSFTSAATAQDLSTILLPGQNQDVWSNDANNGILQQYYVQTPGDLPNSVTQTATQWTQNATNAYAAMKMLESHLKDQTQFTYSVTNPPVPTNVDAVAWLLQTHQGYCTYYATAMTIMARLLGMPARVVNGFDAGLQDAKTKAWTVNGSDAHSWVQVYFPGYGWINFDPTPGFSPDGSSHPSPTPSPTSTLPPTRPTPTVGAHRPTPAPRHTPVPGSSQAGTNGFSLEALARQNFFLVGLSFLTLLFSCIVLFLAIFRYRWRYLSTNAPVISAMFWRVCRLATWAGLPPQTWQTPYEYTRVLSRRYPQAKAPLRRLAELFVRERWAPSSPHQIPQPTDVRELEKLWPPLRNNLLRSLLLRFRRSKQ